jgi:TPR repeat protein
MITSEPSGATIEYSTDGKSWTQSGPHPIGSTTPAKSYYGLFTPLMVGYFRAVKEGYLPSDPVWGEQDVGQNRMHFVLRSALDAQQGIPYQLSPTATPSPSKQGAASSLEAAWEHGQEAYKRGDYPAAVREFLPLAQQGDAHAQGKLGLMYDKGWGVARNDAEAIHWYRKAAEQGLAPAQVILAGRYVEGQPGRLTPGI